MITPATYNCYQPSQGVNPHKVWSSAQSDTAYSMPLSDGCMMVWKDHGANFNRWNLTGGNNLVLGSRTSESSGITNVVIGYSAGSKGGALGEIASTVTGSDNVLIGSGSGGDSVLGLNNVAIGKNAGRLLGSYCVCIGYKAGSGSDSNVLQSGDNNIYLNATNQNLFSTESGGFYVMPIKAKVGVTGKPLLYNDVTGEIFTN